MRHAALLLVALPATLVAQATTPAKPTPAPGIFAAPFKARPLGLGSDLDGSEAERPGLEWGGEDARSGGWLRRGSGLGDEGRRECDEKECGVAHRWYPGKRREQSKCIMNRRSGTTPARGARGLHPERRTSAAS